MTTSTNETMTSVPQSDLEGAAHALENGGIILFPADTQWCLGCDAGNEEAIRRLLQILKHPDAAEAEILVASVEQLKTLAPQLHPRLETLLYYHQRPLGVMVNEVKRLPAVACQTLRQATLRIVRDPFCQQLLRAFPRAIFSVAAGFPGLPSPVSFGSISSEIIEACEHVVRYRQLERNIGKPIVVVGLNEDESELVFLRNQQD
jgi:L-threonylcarbamoyladenylate synthase